MKLVISFSLVYLVAVVPHSVAQTVLQGDSIYLGLQAHKDSLASVVTRLGQRYHKTEIRTWFHALMRNGEDMYGTRVDGYALHYERLGIICCVSEKTGRLFRMQLNRHAFITSSRGIQPGAATFARVIERYGPSQRGKEYDGQPRAQVITFDHKTWFVALRYPHIAFISRGKLKAGEDPLKRQVQEIWLW